MTKSILIERLCETCRVPAGRAEQILGEIFGSIERALNRGERIEIRGFGSFELREYKGYVGRNPRTGSTVDVKPKRLPFFKVGRELKERVDRRAHPERSSEPAKAASSAGGDSPKRPTSAPADISPSGIQAGAAATLS
jgi:integration host factor subunit beta